jgi:hypothetical protein
MPSYSGVVREQRDSKLGSRACIPPLASSAQRSTVPVKGASLKATGRQIDAGGGPPKA